MAHKAMSDWDLVVVGAGSAGAVIAARTTERSDQRVLLVEAGPDYSDPASLPEDLRDSNRNSLVDHDWGFVYQPTPQTRPDVPLPRGKVVGGSSAVNTCIALRGQPDDYDEWGARGCPEWSWERCLPAFIRLENDQDIENEWHGRSGPIPLRRYPPEALAPVQAAFIAGCRALGYPECSDHNDPTTTGYGPHPMNKQGGLRVSTALAYLAPARDRPNLTIRPRTLVRRVVVRDGRVAGLEVETDGVPETIDCPRVVLSAGSIQSPAILVRSGIGPRETLERLGIAVVREAPGVGARLWDHPASMVMCVPRDGCVGWDQPMIQTALRYTAGGSDLFNDMMLEPLTYVQRLDGGPLLFGLAAVVQKPFGHGRLVFESTDPSAQPLVQPDFLCDERDLDRLLEGLEMCLRLAETDALRSISQLIVRPKPETVRDREAIRAWVRRACGSGYHPCGTAPIGSEDDPLAVADQYGRVFGIEGLFIADASIMPTIPRANTNIPTIMIGERFGEWFRDGAR